jgi:hypothetical protein
MGTVLVVYDAKQAQMEPLAERAAQLVREAGHRVQMLRADVVQNVDWADGVLELYGPVDDAEAERATRLLLDEMARKGAQKPTFIVPDGQMWIWDPTPAE